MTQFVYKAVKRVRKTVMFEGEPTRKSASDVCSIENIFTVTENECEQSSSTTSARYFWRNLKISCFSFFENTMT